MKPKKAFKKLMAVLLATIMTLFVLLSATGCGKTVDEPNTGTRTVVDMSGKEVEVPEKVESYCVLYASAINVCAMLDKDCAHMKGLVKGWMDWTYRIFPSLKDNAVIFDKNSVTAEEIIATGTQVVFWSNSTHEALIDPLTSAGIACIYVQISDVDSLKQVVSIVSEVLGTDYARSTANKYLSQCDEMISQASTLTADIKSESAPSVLCLRDTSSLTAYGINHFEGFWATETHLNYIAGSDDPNGKANLTIEQIVEWNPENIVFEIPADINSLKEDPVWSSLSAIKNNKVYNNPSCINSWAAAGVEYLLQYEWALATFYPDIASKFNLNNDVIKFYQDYYDYSMTEQEVQWILAGEMPQ